MRCVSSTEKSDGMVDDTFQNREAIRNTPRASGKIHDKGTATGARYPAGKHRKGSGLEATATDLFGDARSVSIDHRPSGLGRNIAGCKPGASRRDDQVDALVCPLGQRGRDRRGLVGYDRTVGHFETAGDAPLHDSLTAHVFAYSTGGPVTHREDADSYHGVHPTA